MKTLSRVFWLRRTINLLTRVDTILLASFSLTWPRFLPRILDDFAVCFPECVPWEPQLGFTAQWNNPNALFRRPVFDQDPFGCRRRRRNLWMAAFYPWNLPPPLWPATTDSLKCKYTTPVYETDDTFLTRPLPRNQISFPFFGNCSSRE